MGGCKIATKIMGMIESFKTPEDKALKMNLDSSIYGTFAEKYLYSEEEIKEVCFFVFGVLIFPILLILEH